MREEAFVLRSAETGANGAVRDRAVGVCVLRRRAEASAVQLECELEFARDGVRAMLIDRTDSRGREIVWREWRAGGGRTLHANGDAGATGLAIVDWGGPEAVRATVGGGERASTWLELAERARTGALEPGPASLFDPLAREIVSVDVRVAWRAGARDDGGDPRLVRDVELVRADDTLAAAFTFGGEACLALRWQDGPLRAERVTPEDLARCAEDLGCSLRTAKASSAREEAGVAPAAVPAAVKDR